MEDPKGVLSERIKKKQNRNKIKDLKLNSLLEITKAINNNFSTEQLFKIYEDVLKNQLNIGKVALFSNDRGWKLVMSYGLDKENLNINVKNDLLSIHEITEITTSPNPHFHDFDEIIPVFHKSLPLAYVLIGDIDQESLKVSATIKHLPFVQTLTNIIVVAIENKKLAKENIRQEGVRKELELASEMQTMLFPQVLPDDEKLQFAAHYKPHHEVGGDYYDFIRLNENEVIFCMADVSGKGVSAALLMANFQANLRALVNHTNSLTDVARELNLKVLANAKGEKFITLFIAKYNHVTKTLTYVNAGHNPPLMLSDRTVSMLKVGCTGLGMFDEIPVIREGVLNISPNTIVVCYTDGLVELENDEGGAFGIDGLKHILERNSGSDMKSLNNAIINEAESFRENQPYLDDIALLSCRLL